MQKRIKTLLKNNFIFIAIFITVFIGYLSLMKVPKFTPSYNGSDKLYHGIAYFTLTVCWLFTFLKKPKSKYIIVILCVFYGILLEALQATLTNYRTADYYDMFANLLGVVVGLAIFNLVLKKNSVY